MRQSHTDCLRFCRPSAGLNEVPEKNPLFRKYRQVLEVDSLLPASQSTLRPSQTGGDCRHGNNVLIHSVEVLLLSGWWYTIRGQEDKRTALVLPRQRVATQSTQVVSLPINYALFNIQYGKKTNVEKWPLTVNYYKKSTKLRYYFTVYNRFVVLTRLWKSVKDYSIV